jgi:hypothetical protein
VYGELHEDDSRCFLYDSTGKEIQMKKQNIYKNLKQQKQTHYFIIKVLSNAPEWYYPAHWYFQTPTSPEDATKMMENSDTIWEGRKSKKEPVRTLNNSYALGWQVNRSNQFCMLYALYGLLTEDVEKSNPFTKIRLLQDSEIDGREGEDYEDENQIENTRLVITFFCEVLDKYTDLFNSNKNMPLRRKRKTNDSFHFLHNDKIKPIDVLILSDTLIKKQKEAIHHKLIKDEKRYNKNIDNINKDNTLKRQQRSQQLKILHDEFENKKDGDNDLLNISLEDIRFELANATQCPEKYAPEF